MLRLEKEKKTTLLFALRAVIKKESEDLVWTTAFPCYTDTAKHL